MTSDQRSALAQFPRPAEYNPEWILASVSGAGYALWLAESLSSEMELRPGMRVLDTDAVRLQALTANGGARLRNKALQYTSAPYARYAQR